MDNGSYDTSGDHIVGGAQTDEQRFAVSLYRDEDSSQLRQGDLIDRHQKIT